jgi:Fe-S-cluster-containing dehydrogenase component/anaerobic selenocysteine-containing dehydrogenase
MSSELNKAGRIVWRSLEEKADPQRLSDEAKGSDVVKRSMGLVELGKLRRRRFLTLSGSISALAGLEGCIRRPVEKILPYTDAPEDVSPGVPLHYASVLNRRGEALGLLVQCHEGRPTKIEGNPDHPASLGSTDLLAQASVLDLYDPDRARTPSYKGGGRSYADFDAAFQALLDEHEKNGGEGLRILAEPTNSPSFVRMRSTIKARLPGARFHSYAPVNQGNERAGTRLAFGQPLVVNPVLARAKVIVAVDSDFLMTEPGSVLAMRHWSQGRHAESAERADVNRLYAVEPLLTVTGSNADHRLALPAGQIAGYLRALAAELSTQGVPLRGVAPALAGAQPEGVPDAWIKVVAKELVQNRGRSLLLVGSRQPAVVHALAHAINSGLGNAGATVNYTPAADLEEGDLFADVRSLTEDMAAGRVKTLIVLGGNPVYDAPADLKFGEALAKVPSSVCFSSHLHETGAACTWHVPRAHELESWGDQLARSGHYGVQQPLIAALFDARSDLDVLSALAGDADPSGYAVTRATAAGRGFADEVAWQQLVQRGVAERNDAPTLGALPVQEEAIAAALRALPQVPAPTASALEVVFAADNKMLDGRHTNNTWLLELPDPITRITWDNAALLAPKTAAALAVQSGDMIRVTTDAGTIDVAAWVQPGLAQNTVALTLGWGRKRGGSYAAGAGFDVYPLRTSAAPHFAAGAKVQKGAGTYELAQTQEHDAMEGRPIALDATVEQYQERPNFTQWAQPDPSVPPLWQTQDYSQGYQWGMVIDLNRCTGCNACAVACQAENNVPVVGKEQVSRGREMHWLRIDRYYVGDDENQPEVAFQPIACQHCEEAPCENVCPVNATAHSPEGLNDIAYNRCIGTRYCMNNCPYKVRRFNFLNFNEDVPDTKKMQMNPNVTVRFRGVIEKCSYCVQRIQNGKIAAKREGRVLRDGDVTSACQQACPAEAIAFGDINDPNSAVSKARAIDRNYALLADIGTRPRTRFLGKIRNPNPEMKG